MKAFSTRQSCNPCRMVVRSSAGHYKTETTGASHKAMLIGLILKEIEATVFFFGEAPVINFSAHLSTKLRHNYTYLANLFSKGTGMSIEQCMIVRKIDRVKTLLHLGELSLTEIAWKLHYSSVAHLSGQFKKVTGMTPTSFRKVSRPVPEV